MITRGFFRQIARGNSALRACQNAALERLEMQGRILDLGSGSSWSPPFRLRQGRIVRANLDISPRPSLCFNVEQQFPFSDSSFDDVTMLNVLEHLSAPIGCLCEIRRILKPGGRLVVAVPFLYRVHHSPDDFYRLTESALQQVLSKCGFSDVSVSRNGTGSFLASYAIADVLRIPGWLRLVPVTLAVLCDVAYETVLRLVGRRNYRGSEHYPLGYIATANR